MNYSDSEDSVDDIIPRATFLKIIGENVLRARSAKRVPRSFVARHVLIAPRTVYLIETGKSNSGIYTIHQIAMCLGVSVAELLPSPLQLHRAKELS